MSTMKMKTTHKQRDTAEKFRKAQEAYGVADQEESFYITSTSLGKDGHFPRQCTGDGSVQHHDLSPALEWHDVPEGTETLAIVMEDIDAPDPEAPIVPFTHWSVEGVNDFKLPHYRGPNPPTGTHRYDIAVYALDCRIYMGKITKEKLQEAMEGHVLGEAHLVGTYSKEKFPSGYDQSVIAPQVKEQPFGHFQHALGR
ncbi:unnamed protein product [Closterium sp. Naga37s-1]|nr:unnamed protein product [Closterium sp. Naga37s-1]